jgi:hypothetical protein
MVVPLELCMFTKFSGSTDDDEISVGGLTLPKAVMSNDVARSVTSFELALALLQECAKGSNSFFAPYISILPLTFDTLPFQWSFDELKGLLIDINNMTIFHRITDVCLSYCHLCETEAIRSLIGTLESFLWALCVVNSRQNPLPTKDGKLRKVALIPAFDMCNHEPTAGEISTEFSWSSRAFECRAHRNFQPGEEYTIYYGQRTDLDFLLYSGFVCQPPGCNESTGMMLIAKLSAVSKPDLAKGMVMLVNGVDGIQPIDNDEYFIKIGGTLKETPLRSFARAASVSSKEDVQEALKKKLGANQHDIVLTQTEKTFCETLLKERIRIFNDHIQNLAEIQEGKCRPAVLKAQADLYRSYVALLERTKKQLLE